jgi:hypothetical protein
MATHGGLQDDQYGFTVDKPIPDSAVVDMRDFERATGSYRSGVGNGNTNLKRIVGEHKNYPTIKLVIEYTSSGWVWIIEEKIGNYGDDHSPMIEESLPGVHPIVAGDTLGKLFHNPTGQRKEEWEEKRWGLYEQDGDD